MLRSLKSLKRKGWCPKISFSRMEGIDWLKIVSFKILKITKYRSSLEFGLLNLNQILKWKMKTQKKKIKKNFP